MLKSLNYISSDVLLQAFFSSCVLCVYVCVYVDHLELYIKVRLNTRPTYQRQQKFGRGPVIHKTRVLRGSSNPQWKEDFMVNGGKYEMRIEMEGGEEGSEGGGRGDREITW